MAAVAGVGALVLGLTGCYAHDDFVVVEPTTSAATFQLLADDGGYVVVSATAASNTVPGAGWWRVDRDAGTAVALPGAASRISADGTRVLLTDGTLWHEGGTVDPAGGVYSDDLRSRLSVDGGVLTVHPVLGGPSVDVDALVPRPAGVTSVTPLDVSDDGRSVNYRMNGGTGPDLRFVRLGSSPLDLSRPYGSEAMMSPDGLTVARAVTTFVGVSGQTVIDLIDVPTGAVVASSTRQLPDSSISIDVSIVSRFDLLAVSTTGRRAWGVEIRERYARDLCGLGPSPIFLTCQVGSTLSVLSGDGSTVDVSDGNVVRSVDLTPNGLYALVSREHPLSAASGRGLYRAPILVHARQGTLETLSQGVDQPSSDPFECQYFGTPTAAPCTIRSHGRNAQLTDDGYLVAARPMRSPGWYEYRDDGVA